MNAIPPASPSMNASSSTHGEWYFSVIDVVAILTDSSNPTDYFKKMRKRDVELASYVGTNCPQIPMTTTTGKRRKTLAGTTESIFRIIQSIPSSKAEVFKQWMAKAARVQLEKQLGRSVITSAKASDYILPQEDDTPKLE